MSWSKRLAIRILTFWDWKNKPTWKLSNFTRLKCNLPLCIPWRSQHRMHLFLDAQWHRNRRGKAYTGRWLIASDNLNINTWNYLATLTIIVHFVIRHVLQKLHKRKVMTVWNIIVFELRNLSAKFPQEFGAIPESNRKFLSPCRYESSKGMARVNHFCVSVMTLHQLSHIFGFCLL